MRSILAWIGVSVASALVPGCTLVSLDALQSGVGGAGATQTSVSGTGSASSATTSVTSSTSTVSSSASGSSTSSGCSDTFCATQTNTLACGDFDTTTTGLDNDWQADTFFTGATTGSVARDDTEGFSCPSSARTDLIGTTGDYSWSQIKHTATLGANLHFDVAGMVKRTGPNGALDWTSVLEVDYPEANGVMCQMYIKPYDAGSPNAYIFLQTYSDAVGSTQLSNATLPLADTTAEKWTAVEFDLDWSASPPIAIAKVAGASVPITLSDVCAIKPPTVTGLFGMSYEDRTQTVLIDNATERVH